MNLTLKRVSLAIAGAGLLTVYGCGGGGGSSVSGVSGVSSPTITGVAATGAALAYATVSIKNSAGNFPCVETSITTSGVGSYTCTLKSGETAPFFVLVTDPTGQIEPLVSIATQTPVAGTPLTVNATPLTTAIVAQTNGGDALSVFNNHSVNTTDLSNATTNVLAQLAPVLTAIGAVSYNPFTTSITAATASQTGNTADQVLDVVKVTRTATGALALSTIDNPTPVTLADASSSGSALGTPSASASDLSSASKIAAATLTNCFALAVNQRVLAETVPAPVSTLGGPEIDQVATACENVVASGANGGSALPFQHNGYSGGQFFYDLLKDNAMTGATFSVPEIVAYYAADANATSPLLQKNWAIVNLRYIDANGVPGNAMTVAAELPGTSTVSRPTNWWLVGNQQLVDINIRPQFRRQTQLNGSVVSPSFPNRFQSGLAFKMNPTGPSTDLFDHIYVTGSGLPTNGVWLKKFTTTINSQSVTFFDLMQYRLTSAGGTGYNGTTCGGGQGYDCNVFWFAATTDLNGTTIATNSTNKRWTQSGDGGYDGVAQGTRPTKGSSYTVRYFLGSTEVTSLSSTKKLVADVIPPTRGVSLPWNSAGSSLLAFLSPAGSQSGALSAGTSVTIDWTQNVAAPQVGGVNLWTTDGTQYGWDGSVQVARGITSKAVTTVFDISDISGSSTSPRAVLLGHRVLDGSARQDVYAYN